MNNDQKKKLEIAGAEVFAIVALVVMIGYLIYRNIHHG